MSLELFSFDDMFATAAPTGLESNEGTENGHSQEQSGYAVVPLPSVHEMSRDELLELIQTHTAAIFMQEMLLNSLADVLLENGIVSEPQLQKRFEELIQRHTLRKEG